MSSLVAIDIFQRLAPQRVQHSASSTNAFSTGDSNQAYVSIPTPYDVNAYFALTHAYGGSAAIEIGVAAPGKLPFGVSPFSHSVPVFKPTGN